MESKERAPARGTTRGTRREQPEGTRARARNDQRHQTIAAGSEAWGKRQGYRDSRQGKIAPTPQARAAARWLEGPGKLAYLFQMYIDTCLSSCYSYPMPLTTERQTYLLRLRRKGVSIAQIAEQMDVSDSTIRQTLSSAYKNLIKEHEAEEAKVLELERLDEIQTSFYDIALEGDTKAADVVFKAMDRRAKLLGLDAPERKAIDANIQVGWLNDEEPTTIYGEVVQVDSKDDRSDVSDLGEFLVIQESIDPNAEGSERGAGSDQ